MNKNILIALLLVGCGPQVEWCLIPVGVGGIPYCYDSREDCEREHVENPLSSECFSRPVMPVQNDAGMPQGDSGCVGFGCDLNKACSSHADCIESIGCSELGYCWARCSEVGYCEVATCQLDEECAYLGPYGYCRNMICALD